MTAKGATPVVVSPLQDLTPEAAQQALFRIEAIFWETAVSPPTEPAARSAFHHQWLGQYLTFDPDLVFVARDEGHETIGYLVGTFASLATSPRFASLPYARTFAAAVTRYPAHLHINLTQAWRGRGVGGRLIAPFAKRVGAAGLPGFHVVTGAEARNVRFYTRQAFREIDRTIGARGNAVVFLGHDIVANDAPARA